MCSDLTSASQGCAFFSATGIIFMSFVGVMLMKQPFFILGIDDVDKAKGSAFGAAAAFFFTFLVSIVYLLCEGSPALAPAQTQGRGHVHRFGEYSNVGFSDLPDADIISENNQGSFA